MTTIPADTKPHFVLVPLMAQGHMIPMIDLGRRLAEHGVFVSIITTPFNAFRIKTTIDRLTKTDLPIRFVQLRFPCAEVGLPEGCENIDTIPPWELHKKFFDASALLSSPLETHLKADGPRPTCIISDSGHPWTLKVAHSLNIPRFTYFGVCCFTLLCELNNNRSGVRDTVKDDREPFLVPGLAHRIELTRAQNPGFFAGQEWAEFREEMWAADAASTGVVVNTFDELEPWYVAAYERAMEIKVWALGPFSLFNKEVVDMAERGKVASIDPEKCTAWLDSMEVGSVLYVSFGSLARVKQDQLMEIAGGLEASMCPFIWVVKEVELEWCVELESFEERTRARGLVIKGWAPQVMILSHPSVGGFLTHCGWNSSMEALSMGVPMITWPFFGDQFINERMIVEVVQIGVGIGVKKPNYLAFGLEAVPELVVKDDVEEAVRRLMQGGVEGDKRRERARDLGRKAQRTIEEGGSSYFNMTHFIQSVSKISSLKNEEKK